MAKKLHCHSIAQCTWIKQLRSETGSAVRRLRCPAMQPASTIQLLALSAGRPGTLSGLDSHGSDSTFQNNIWWSLIRSKHNNLMNYFIHDERDLSRAYVASCRKFLKKINTNTGQSRKRPSARAGGPAHKESGSKQQS